MIIDVHAHLDFLPEEKLEKIENNSKIKFVITNSVNMKSSLKNLELVKKYFKIKLAVGLYPEETLEKSDWEKFKDFVLKNKKYVFAIGEIGMDFSLDLPNREIQEFIFRKELELAEKLNVPVLIHTRKAEKEIVEILKEYPRVKKVLHCFSGNFKLVKEANEMGCYFSIPTNIVRSEHFQKMVKELPHEKILTETDSPYLSPFKEKENEPAFIEESIKKISEIWSVSEKKVEEKIEENFERVFMK